MDVSIWICVITLVGNMIMWGLNRRALVKDRKENNDSDQNARISVLEENQKRMGELLNDISTVQKMTVDGVSYIVDGLETKKILNGTGKQYLKDINNYYTQKGFDSLKFHSLEKPKKENKAC